jgi:asparagine synthase (glutamine-hydrolysing)
MISRDHLSAMLEACSWPSGASCENSAGNSIAFGVCREWPGQQMGRIPGVQIAVDADLYNFEEISAPFDGQANSEQTSLAETLARLYLYRGLDFLRLLHGAFAISIWDESKRILLLAVDRFGCKTLYWSQIRGRLSFSSRVGAVRLAMETPPEVNPDALMQFLLFSTVPAPLTIFKGVERLSPGHVLLFERDEVRRKSYWNLEYREDTTRSRKYWANGLREEMRSAVHRHLTGLVPESAGAYLSGGTDSSSVVAFMSERFKPSHTFSISFPVAGFNEIQFARTTATRFATCHHEKCLQPSDAAEAIPKLIRYYDEPFANSSAIASYSCAVLAREQGVNTLLAGDGGDELFGGNARYATDKQFALYHSVPHWMRRYLIEPMANRLPGDDGWMTLPRRYIRRAQIPNPRRILSYNFFLCHAAQEIFDADFLKDSGEAVSLRIAENHFHSAQASNELNRLLYLDVKMTLGDNDLRKVSGTAELAGLRVRYPLLDTRLVEFSGRIPARLKLKGMEKRYIFKQAMAGLLPKNVLYKKKHGFGVPLGEWFLRDSRLKALVQDVLNDPRTRQRGYFRREFLDRLLDLHRQGNASFYGEIVWYLVALELWHREHLESSRERLDVG